MCRFASTPRLPGGTSSPWIRACGAIPPPLSEGDRNRPSRRAGACPRRRQNHCAGTSLTPAGDTRPSKGADISCGKCVASLQSRAFQGEPVPPGYAPAARYPLRSPRGTETDRHVGRGLAPAVGKTTVPEPRLPQQVTRGPVKARTFPAGNVSLRFKAAPSRGNQFPLDTRLRRDTPSALRGGPKPTVT